MAPTCEAITNPDSIWPPMCPNIAAAYLFAVLFGLTTVAHTAQMFIHRKVGAKSQNYRRPRKLIVALAILLGHHLLGIDADCCLHPSRPVHQVRDERELLHLLVHLHDGTVLKPLPLMARTLMPVGKGRSCLDERICLHGHGTHGLQLHPYRLDLQGQGMAIRLDLRAARRLRILGSSRRGGDRKYR